MFSLFARKLGGRRQHDQVKSPANTAPRRAKQRTHTKTERPPARPAQAQRHAPKARLQQAARTTRQGQTVQSKPIKKTSQDPAGSPGAPAAARSKAARKTSQHPSAKRCLKSLASQFSSWVQKTNSLLRAAPLRFGAEGPRLARGFHLEAQEAMEKQFMLACRMIRGIARSHCKESLQGVIARSHCKESLQGVIARSHCKGDGKVFLRGTVAEEDRLLLEMRNRSWRSRASFKKRRMRCPVGGQR